MEEEQLKKELAVSWDNGSEYYDTYISHGIKTDTEKQLWMKTFAECLPKEEHLNILDVGCGTGAMSLILAESGHEVTGLDLSEGMMNVGRKKAAEQNLSVEFITGDAEYPPFEDETFDVVVNRHLLWTLMHPDTAVSNWYRVLKPGGMLILIDGHWEMQDFLEKFMHSLSMRIAHIVEKHPHGHGTYSESLLASLPNRGGAPLDKVTEYFKTAGFLDVQSRNLNEIAEYQRSLQNWYQNLSPSRPYYLVSGVKKQ